MNQFLKKFQKQSIHIVGYGHEWTTTTQFLLDQWINPSQITIHDSKSNKELPAWTTHRLWEDFWKELWSADVIFRTAGIPLQHSIFIWIDINTITSQAQLFFDHFQGKKIGITWSKWKSTTTCMLHHMLESAGKRALLVGNIWAWRLTDIDRNDPECIAVCELSSGQLEWLELTLDIWIFTNFYPIHHIGRHWSLEKYRNAKLQLIKNSEILVLGSQIVQTQPEIMEAVWNTKVVEYGPQWDYWFSNGVFISKNWSIHWNDVSMQIIGDHNRENACALFAVCEILWLDYKKAQDTVDTFTGLPHRLEKIWIVNWITWINDAIATTPQATMAAIATIWDDLETIFLGGKDEGYEYKELCEVINKHTGLKHIILFPDTHEVYLHQLDHTKFTFHISQSMADAVHTANTETSSWKVALLSCATSSFSLWTSYRQKWDLFREEVGKLR
jgi:UDP-N-acetylmuramoylalanine--D-glutamate ligase